MAAFPVPITRIGGGGYFTDVDPWGRTIASTLPPTHVLHLELERLNQKVNDLESENKEILGAATDLKRKVGDLRARLRTEVPADSRPTQAYIFERIDSAIGTADANILRAILREVCRESEQAATIAASILPSPPSATEEQSNISRAPSTTRTTSTRRTSVRFQEPPISSTSNRSTSTRRTSTRLQEPAVPTSMHRTAESSERQEHIRRRRSERMVDTEQRTEAAKAEFTTPRRTKRRAEEAEAEDSASRKRRSTAPLICTNCNKEYNASENTRGVCRKHSGHKKVETGFDTFWADWDEMVHGRCEAYINDTEYAEGFVWSCCGEYSNVKRCTTSKHSNK